MQMIALTFAKLLASTEGESYQKQLVITVVFVHDSKLAGCRYSPVAAIHFDFDSTLGGERPPWGITRQRGMEKGFSG